MRPSIRCRGNADSVGMRNIIGANEVEQVHDVLRKRDETISTATWNRRYREYMEKIRSGSLIEIATVLRNLCLLRNDKDLSYGERNMLGTARALLVQELFVHAEAVRYVGADGCSQAQTEPVDERTLRCATSRWCLGCAAALS